MRIDQAGRSSSVFLSTCNLLNLLRQTGELGLIAMAMTILISLGSAIYFSEGENIERQWEDCGLFRTDHWRYVFGNERPRANLNQGAGLDVSPAVRDYLGLGNKDACDWKFVESAKCRPAMYGENNTIVILRRQSNDRFERRVVLRNEATD